MKILTYLFAFALTAPSVFSAGSQGMTERKMKVRNAVRAALGKRPLQTPRLFTPPAPSAPPASQSAEEPPTNSQDAPPASQSAGEPPANSQEVPPPSYEQVVGIAAAEPVVVATPLDVPGGEGISPAVRTLIDNVKEQIRGMGSVDSGLALTIKKELREFVDRLEKSELSNVHKEEVLNNMSGLLHMELPGRAYEELASLFKSMGMDAYTGQLMGDIAKAAQMQLPNDGTVKSSFDKLLLVPSTKRAVALHAALDLVTSKMVRKDHWIIGKVLDDFRQMHPATIEEAQNALVDYKDTLNDDQLEHLLDWYPQITAAYRIKIAKVLAKLISGTTYNPDRLLVLTVQKFYNAEHPEYEEHMNKVVNYLEAFKAGGVYSIPAYTERDKRLHMLVQYVSQHLPE